MVDVSTQVAPPKKYKSGLVRVMVIVIVIFVVIVMVYSLWFMINN